jgi:hypothetical protein
VSNPHASEFSAGFSHPAGRFFPSAPKHGKGVDELAQSGAGDCARFMLSAGAA